jgi:hypothetical protein
VHEEGFVDAVEFDAVGSEVAAAFEVLVRHADGGGETAEEETAGFEDAPEVFEDCVEMGFVAAEVEDGVAVNEVEEGVREGCGLERFGAEVVCGETRRESGSEGASLVDGGRVVVDGEDLVAFAEEIDEIATGAAAGVEDTHAGDDVAAKEMIEEIDINEAELLLQGGHGSSVFFDDTDWRGFIEGRLIGGVLIGGGQGRQR